MSKPPLRPATPIDAELAKPHLDDETEIENASRLAEKDEELPIDERRSRLPKKPLDSNSAK